MHEMRHHQCWWVIFGLEINVALFERLFLQGNFRWPVMGVTSSRGWRYQSERTQVLTPFENHFAFEIHFHTSAVVTIFCLNPPILCWLSKSCHLCLSEEITRTTWDRKKTNEPSKNYSRNDVKLSNSFSCGTGKSLLFSWINLNCCKNLPATTFFTTKFWEMWPFQKSSFCVWRLGKISKKEAKHKILKKKCQTEEIRKFATIFCWVVLIAVEKKTWNEFVIHPPTAKQKGSQCTSGVFVVSCGRNQNCDPISPTNLECSVIMVVHERHNQLFATNLGYNPSKNACLAWWL